MGINYLPNLSPFPMYPSQTNKVKVENNDVVEVCHQRKDTIFKYSSFAHNSDNLWLGLTVIIQFLWIELWSTFFNFCYFEIFCSTPFSLCFSGLKFEYYKASWRKFKRNVHDKLCTKCLNYGTLQNVTHFLRFIFVTLYTRKLWHTRKISCLNL